MKKTVQKLKQDAEWSAEVRKKADGYCQLCGNIGTDPHHVVYRRHTKVKYLIMNGVFLCRFCHSFAHRKPKLFLEWFFKKYGENLYWEIKRMAIGIVGEGQ